MHGGNITAGIIAYIGVSLVHLATNLCDDYFDYKKLIKEDEFCAKDCKCAYIRNGQATICDLRNAIITMLTIAGFCGGILCFIADFYVILFALITLPIALFYSKLSSKGLGDIAVIIVYGPLMFGGVYYAMTKGINIEVIILSIACALIVEAVLYTHMLMDFNDDIKANKTTLCTRLKTPYNALRLLIGLYISAYIFITIFAYSARNYNVLISLLTIPLVIKLYNSLKIYNENSSVMPPIEIWNFPLNIKKQLPINAPFFHRFILAINISTVFMILVCIGLLLN